jgi:integrase
MPDKKMAAITTADLDNFLHSLKVAPGTKNTFRRDIRTLWSFAEKRGWALAKVAKATEAATVTDAAPGILTPAQAAALLIHSPDNETTAFHAIGLFAGLRAAELARLDWKDIDLESGFIHVGASVSKTRSRRLVPILPNLAAWLAPIAKKEGPLSAYTFRYRHENARAAAGITEWPENGLRHSFVSYRLAATGNAAQTALEAGHDQAVLFRHYRELVRPADARAYFSIRPEQAENVISMDAA